MTARDADTTEGAMEPCPICSGTGMVSGWPETPWEQCPACEGGGKAAAVNDGNVIGCWRDRVIAAPFDLAWFRWWLRSWRIGSASKLAEKAGVTRMTAHRWRIGRSPVPEYIRGWARDNLPHEPALPYPGMTELTNYPAATEEERREFAEMDLIRWPTPRKRRERR